MQKLEKFLNDNLEKLIFFFILFLFIFAIASTSSYYDTDLWARLIVGKAFWQSGTILKNDFLSYIPTGIWYDHEWGSGVIFYAFFKLFSYHGFILLHSLLTLFTFYFIYKTINYGDKKSFPDIFSILFFLISILAFMDTNNFIVRCQSFTFLFFAIYIYIFECAKKGNQKILWITPFLMLFWNNIHGGCISGIGLFLIYILGEFLSKKDFKYFILPFLSNILVLPINPWGLSYISFLIYANTFNRIWIIEWYGLFNMELFCKKYFIIKFFIIYSLLAEAIYIIKSSKRDWTKIILTLTTIILGIRHLKHLPFAVITVTIFFYDDIRKFFINIFNKAENRYTKIFIYASILTFIIFSFSEHKFKPIVGDFYPYKSAEFIRINKIKGNLLCDFSTGSFLGYKLYPQNKIFMDGRYEEVFNFETLRLLISFLAAEEDSNILLNKYPTDIILARNGYTVLEKLIESTKWTPIFYENDFITLVRTEKLKENYTLPPDNIEYYEKTIFDTDINFMIKSKRNDRN